MPHTSGVGLDITEHADPASLDERWEREDMGCVFMCGYPWTVRTDRPRLLAFPVPSPPRYGGRSVYFTDFVVRTDSRFGTLEDTFGFRLAYSIEALLLTRFVAPSSDRLEVFLERQHKGKRRAIRGSPDPASIPERSMSEAFPPRLVDP